jgi:hypothetical protein
MVLQPHPGARPKPSGEVGPGLRQDVGVKINDQHYFAAGAGVGTAITWPHFRQVRSASLA